MKFLLKPSKEGVKVLHQMQHATLQAARVMSQQLQGKIEIIDNEVVDLVGPANEAEIILNGKIVNALLDSGSQVTSVSESYYRECLSQYPLQPVDVPGLLLQPAGGGSMPYLGMIISSLKIPHLTSTFQAKVVVVPDTEYHHSTPALVGTGIIRRSRDECRSENGNQYLQRMKLPSSWAQAYEYVNAADKSTKSAKTMKTVRIHPGQTINVPVAIRTNATFETNNVMVELESDVKGIAFTPAVISLRNNSSLERISLPVTNTSNSPVTIQADKVLFSLQPIQNIKEGHNVQCQSATCSTQADKEKDDLVKKLSAMTKLEGEQKKQFENLLAQYPDLFAHHDNDLGHTTLVTHKIPLVDETPIKEKVRRIPHGMFEEVRKQIEQMLITGVIRPSHSSWNSNIVLALKKDSTWRLCTDLRSLNSRTIKDSYSIPRLEDTLDKLAGAKFFSCIDLKNGYWQVEIEESDKHKTAFSVPGLGFYEYNDMTFGLCNAPATFQRLMEQVLYDLNNKICAIYLDDILIWSSSLDEHLERLDADFKRLAEAGLKLKPSKCSFFKDKVGYLGYVISSKGVETDSSKIDAVTAWETPKNADDIRKFLGFTGYYRRFVKNYAQIAKPLNDLLGEPKKKRGRMNKNNPPKQPPFVWGAEQQQAFDTLIEALTTAPILAYPDFTKPFKLHTDASGTGLGAVLYQEFDGQEHVIAYASRGLKASEKNYPAHKLEFLALKWSVCHKFHEYLYGNKFEVLTDNNPLTYVY